MKLTNPMVAAAALGMLAGATGCDDPAKPAAGGAGSASPAAKATAGAKHDCKGKNECKGKGGCKGS